MPGGYGTSGPWGSSGDSYTTGSTPGGAAGNSSSSNNWGPPNTDDNYWNPPNTDNNTNDTSTWEDAYNEMKGAGQWGGGVGGGVYDKGPVVYPKEMYTDEGWAEVQKYGWSSKLKSDFQHDGKYSIIGKDEEGNYVMDQWGKFSSLPEGVIYSSNANDGRGGFIKTSDFVYPGGDGGGRSWGPGWGGSWGGPGGFGSGIGGMYSRRWNPVMKNVNNYNSPIAEQLAYNRANRASPKNQWMFTQMLQSMPGGGITNAV